MGDPESDRRREALVQAGMVLTSDLSLPSVLQKIVELACDVADARYGALGVLGPDGAISDFVTHGVTEQERRDIGHLPAGRGILGVLIRDAQPLRLARIQDDPRSAGFPSNHPPMTSFLGVPLSVRGHVYGNLYLTEKRGAPEFTEQDERAVVTLAAQAAVAVENARLYQQAEARQERLEATARVTAAILSGIPLAQVLALIVRSARELADADVATIATPDGADHLVISVAEGRHAESLRGTRFTTEGSISGEVMRSRRTVTVPDASGDDRIQQALVRSGDVGAALFVALAVRERAFGTLMVANRQGGPPLGEEAVSMVEGFAAQAGVALEYARVREELGRLAILEDRERIAQELHDGVIQALFAVGMSLQGATLMPELPELARARIGAAVDDIDGVIRDLRNYIFALRPGMLADRQLDRALRELAEGLAERSDVDIEVSIDPRAAALLAGREADVLQMTRESLSNAIRHSGADRVKVVLSGADGYTLLEIADDGRGFDPGAAGPGQGLGNLRARARTLGGRVDIESNPGGTRVTIRLPHP